MSFIAGAIILSSAVSAGAGAYNKSKDRKAQKKQQRENRKTERRNNISAILGGGRSGGVSGQQAISGSGMGDALTALAQMGQAYAATKVKQGEVDAEKTAVDLAHTNKLAEIAAYNYNRGKGNSVTVNPDGTYGNSIPGEIQKTLSMLESR